MGQPRHARAGGDQLPGRWPQDRYRRKPRRRSQIAGSPGSSACRRHGARHEAGAAVGWRSHCPSLPCRSRCSDALHGCTAGARGHYGRAGRDWTAGTICRARRAPTAIRPAGANPGGCCSRDLVAGGTGGAGQIHILRRRDARRVTTRIAPSFKDGNAGAGPLRRGRLQLFRRPGDRHGHPRAPQLPLRGVRLSTRMEPGCRASHPGQRLLDLRKLDAG